jgi:Cu2+-containing amine oxidase
MSGLLDLRPWILAIVLALGSAVTVRAQTSIGQLDIARFQVFCPNAITQDFPTSGAVQTTWKICWREVAGNNSIADPNGLVIGPVYFRKTPSAPFVRILWDMRVSDYFVPYHAGSPRYYDLSAFNFVLTQVSAADCPANVGGVPISPHVCKEVHDRGLMWKDPSGVRRGEEIVLWGSIELAPHAHNALWRIDIDLGGVANTASHVSHEENTADPAGTAADVTTQINVAQGLTWSPRTHDVVEIANPSLKNARGDTSAYQLLPLVTGGGLTQHFEPFTQNDAWVTPYNPAQFAAKDLPSYVAGSPPVANRDLVLWFKSSIHHHPRDEDGVYRPDGTWVGTAHSMWAGFMLVPHNLFDCSPFYQPCP